MSPVVARVQLGGLLALGTGGAAGVLAVASAARSTADLAAALVPAGFLVAGALGGRARPDHVGIRLLAAVGALHLAAFAIVGWAAIAVAAEPVRWFAAATGTTLYVAGFAALAVLIACSPSGRPATPLQRGFAAATLAACTAAVLDEVLLHRQLVLLDGVRAGSLAAPAPLPLLATTVDPVALAVLPVPAALIVLTVSARRMSETDRRALGWDVLATALLAALLVGSPLADVLAPGAWDVVFPVGATVVPFLLLAALARFRLLDVDLLVARTLARGVALAVVLGVTATATAAAGRAAGVTAAAACALAAVLVGPAALAGLERVADRVTTGGRIADAALADGLAAALVAADRSRVPQQACEIVQRSFDAAWVRVHWPGGRAESGRASVGEIVRVPLTVAGEHVGDLLAGERRGGWSPRQRRRVERAAAQLALLVRETALSRDLAERVRELDAARERLVGAEASARRRIERDLHDGAQQQLVALLARIGIARSQVPDGHPVAPALDAAGALAREALRDLRHLVAGIAPPLLEDRGLTAAIESRADGLPIAVTVDADPRLGRYPERVEAAAFFVVSEALANVLKHAGTDRARVVVALGDDGLRVAVADEGNGGADPDGRGIRGLRDRVEALGGRFEVHAVPGVGTTVSADLPVRAAVDA